MSLLVRIYLFVLLLSGTLATSGQNLVPNAGFEQMDSCPPIHSQLPTNWTKPLAHTGTPDFIHACSQTVHPERFIYGGQKPKAGQGMMGFYASDYYFSYYREYIQCRLKEPLKPCTYTIRFHVSLADSSAYAVNGLGCILSKNSGMQWSEPNNGWITESDVMLSDSVISDMEGWVELSFVYRAQGGEQYLTIGQMNPDMLRKDMPGYPLWNFSYYFIDEVSLESMATEQIDLIPDSSLCEGQQLQIVPPSGYHFVSRNFSNPISREGHYYASITDTDSFCVLTDTGYIQVDSLVLDLGRDTFICIGDSLFLDAEYPKSSYLWENGDTAAKRKVWEEGNYVLHMENGVCALSDTIAVGVVGHLPEVRSIDTSICMGDSLVVDLPDGEYDLIWFDGDLSRSKTFEVEGSLLAVAHNACFSDTLSVVLTMDECASPAFFIPTAFSPNGDGYNDQFALRAPVEGTVLSVRLYNRWGELVWSQSGEELQWDGKYKGSNCQQGVYLMELRIEDVAGKTEHLAQSLHLLR